MQKLTAIKARALIHDLSGLRTIREELFRQALEIALPVLEQQEWGCESCGGNGHIEIDHGELGIEHITCHKCTSSTEQEKGNDGWVEWHGGRLPPISGMVKVKLRDSTETDGLATNFTWTHHRAGDFDDIIAYRVIENDGREG